MREMTQCVIRRIENDFKVNGLYKFQKQDTFCVHVNSIVNIGLSELGYEETVSGNLDKMLKSKLFAKDTNLFYKEINQKDEITNHQFNTCKNALASLALIANGNKVLAEQIIDFLYNSPLFVEEVGLFCREFDSKSKNINPLLITQTNLWVVIALSKLQKTDEAKKLISSLEELNFDQKNKLFVSQDCERKILNDDYDKCCIHDKDKNYFPDDQALAVIAYNLLEQKRKAADLLKCVFNSKLYDHKTGLFNRSFNNKKTDTTKTSYKNGLMGIALGVAEYNSELRKLNDSMVELLYDEDESLFNFSNMDTNKIPDTSILALLSIEFNNLKHLVF